MSISASGATGYANNAQWRSPATTSASSPSAASADESVDGIQVNLPNGFSVGVFRITRAPGETQGTPASGSGGSSAQMLQTAEQLVADFANASGVASNGDPSANPLDSPLASSLAPGQSLDGIDVELPNGYSAEIYHVDPVGGGGNQGAEDQMVDTMQQLAGYLSTYPATAAEAYTKTAADASSPTANVNSVA